jgi:D-alanine--poly(phosphoribitol) ligase subunit 1
VAIFHAAICLSGFLSESHRTIDRWALAAPGAIAHISGDQRLTYGELRRRSDALAAYLAKRFGDDRSPIAVLGHREPEMLIAFLGTVKSRRPYVPLDTVLPRQRIDKILAISRPALLLTPEDVAKLSCGATPAPETRAQCDDPFYILFTSGSTGEPKGVIITLGCLEHFVRWMLEEQKFVPRGNVPEYSAVLIRSLGDGSVLQPRHGRHALQHQPRSGG